MAPFVKAPADGARRRSPPVERMRSTRARGARVCSAPVRVEPWLRTTLTATGAVLLITGGGWLALHYGAAEGGLPHPLEAWLMRLHGLASFAALFTMGALASAHLPLGWRLSARHCWAHQRRTGLGLCVLAALLALSAYLLYYFAPEALRPALGWAHAAAGVAMAGLVGLHARKRRD